MAVKTLNDSERPASDLIQEAIALLRHVSSGLFLAYYIGSIPFWLALLYFVSDMRQSAYAHAHLAEESLLVGLVYIWMRCWHSYFGISLRSLLSTSELPAWTWRRVASMAAAQAFIQPLGLIVRAIALVLTIPFVWVALYYQAAALEETGSDSSRPSISSRAWAAAKLWPAQAHWVVFQLTLFSLFVLVNVVAVLVLGPQILKVFFGIETPATLAPMAYVLNSTFFLTALAFTQMCVDPIWKAVCVLRSFYADSLTTGADLRLRLREAKQRSPHQTKASLLHLVVWVAFLFTLPVAQGAMEAAPAPASAPASSSTVAPDAVNQSVESVLARREFAWRLPPAEDAKKEMPSWMKSMKESIGKFLRKSWGTMKKFIDWLKSVFPSHRDKEGQEADGNSNLRYYLYAAVALALGLIGWLVWRMRKVKIPTHILTASVFTRPDIEASDVAADLLPEDEWLRFARELAAKGEYRLALRAAYLACIAHLGERQLLTIAKYKSNREYSRELTRRARTREELLAAFQENLFSFERVWYGEHLANGELMDRFEQNLQRIRSC